MHKLILLPPVHSNSIHHIHPIHQLPQPIHLPPYPQTNPLPHYQIQPFPIFHHILPSIQHHLPKYLLKSQIQ
ncbi:hypothetical protein, partial [Bacillus altitudinis]|uniref:hypothetical protein n=1 Tax=Bacillus altitudinis TaxID=293387 RepID=UPI003B525AD6